MELSTNQKNRDFQDKERQLLRNANNVIQTLDRPVGEGSLVDGHGILWHGLNFAPVDELFVRIDDHDLWAVVGST